MKILLHKPVTLVVVSAALALCAATPANSTRSANATDPKTSVPPLVYRSAFDGYRPNAEANLGKWQEANDKVGRIGGWRAYAKEAAAPDKPASVAMEHKR